VYHGHGGVTVGSEMSGGVKNMHVSNCLFMGTDVGLRFKSKRGRGGVVENIYISNISMTDIPTNAISFNLYYGGKSVSEMLADGRIKEEQLIEPITEETPQFKNISINNIVIKGAQQAVFLQGLPEMNLENVSITNLLGETINGVDVIDANGVKIKDIELITTVAPVMNFYNVKNVQAEGLNFQDFSTPIITVSGAQSEQLKFKITSKKSMDELVKLSENLNPEVVDFINE
jgi:polygalacturonase